MEPLQIPLSAYGSTREAWKHLAAVKSTVGMVLCLGDSSEAEQRMTVSDLTCSLLTNTHTHTRFHSVGLFSFKHLRKKVYT